MRLNLLRHLALTLVLVGPAAAQEYRFDVLEAQGSIYRYPSDLNNQNRATGAQGDRFWPVATIWNAARPSQSPSELPFLTPCCMYRTSYGAAINDLGQVVGDESGRAVLWNAGASRPVLLAGESLLHHAIDLNNAGTVVGYRDIGSGQTRAVIWEGGGLRDLAAFGSGSSYASAINEAGTVAGMSVNGTQAHATLWQGNTMVDLGAGWAYGLNDQGQAVGQSGSHAVLWNGTQATLLDGTDGSFASDINNRGWVVGSAVDDAAAETRRAMLWYGGRAIELNSFLSQAQRDAGWHLASAVAINDHGWIVGQAFDGWGTGVGYVLSIPAVPEPASMAMLLAGLGVIGVAARRRTQRERKRRPGRSTA